jgi:tRNA pseudouridine55 synthase
MSSHDVVAQVRRKLATRQVGHAGTLDPMATGLLVVLVGEATRLSAYLTADDKRYATTILLGVATDSLDADGAEVARAPLPEALRREIEAWPACPAIAAAVEVERARSEQIPPAISAIHVDGERAYERARRGEEVTIAPRAVQIRALALTAARLAGDAAQFDLTLDVTKGYYVRALARDLGHSLGLPAHLIALRRLASGVFSVDEATALDAPDLAATLRPVEEAARRALPGVELSVSGERRARLGQPLGPEDFAAPPPEGTGAWFAGPSLVAIGEVTAGAGRVLRGFPAPKPGAIPAT